MAVTDNLQATLVEAAQAQKEVTINEALEVMDGIVGIYALSTTGGATTVSTANAQKGVIRVTGTLSSDAEITLPTAMNGGERIVVNATAGAFAVKVRFGAGGTWRTVTQGQTAIVADGWIQILGTGASSGAGMVETIVVAFDGGGAEIPDNQQSILMATYGFTINEWTLLADQSGSIDIGVWKDTYANWPPTGADSITNSNDPAIAAATKAQDVDLSNWTTQTVAAGDILVFNVDSCTTITWCYLILKVTRT
jgi:hypothetical protein